MEHARNRDPRGGLLQARGVLGLRVLQQLLHDGRRMQRARSLEEQRVGNLDLEARFVRVGKHRWRIVRVVCREGFEVCGGEQRAVALAGQLLQPGVLDKEELREIARQRCSATCEVRHRVRQVVNRSEILHQLQQRVVLAGADDDEHVWRKGLQLRGHRGRRGVVRVPADGGRLDPLRAQHGHTELLGCRLQLGDCGLRPGFRDDVDAFHSLCGQ